MPENNLKRIVMVLPKASIYTAAKSVVIRNIKTDFEMDELHDLNGEGQIFDLLYFLGSLNGKKRHDLC